MVMYGVPGIGKTTLAAQVPGVVFMIDRSEDGINRLKEANLVPPDIAVMPAIGSWVEALEALEQLRTGEHQFRCLAVDALGGFERLCHEEVCRRDFKSEWGDSGFMGYMRGFEVSLADWRGWINALDRLRDERQMSILLLGHARVKQFKNPSGLDYDRYQVDVHDKTWALTHRWADMVLFANYELALEKVSKQKAKAHGGQARMFYTEYHAAFDAKNRHNLPPEIEMGNSGAEAWANLVTAIKEGRNPNTNGKAE